MGRRLLSMGLVLVVMAPAQTQIDLNRQVRNALPYTSGGTNATSQVVARENVGTPFRVATDFGGADIGEMVNSAFASFGPNQCGTVIIPAGDYTFATQIQIQSGCTLIGAGRAGGGFLLAKTSTTLRYNGAAATSAIRYALGATTTSIRDLTIKSALTSGCPNSGRLAWNPAASGENKWQCYDGTTYSTPVIHLAGIQLGPFDPQQFNGSTEHVIDNVDTHGEFFDTPCPPHCVPYPTTMNYGFYISNCEHCTLSNVTATAHWDGFYFLGNQPFLMLKASAQYNRYSGIHARGPGQNITCVSCLMQSNNAQPSAAGLRLDGENTAFNHATGFTTLRPHFEANSTDVVATSGHSAGHVKLDGFVSISGTFTDGTQFRNCLIPDGSLVTVDGNANVIVNGCNTTGEVTKTSSQFAYIKTDQSNTLPLEVWKNDTSGSRLPHKFYELSLDGKNRLALRAQKSGSRPTVDSGLQLENSENATSETNAASAPVTFVSKVWDGAAQTINEWRLLAAGALPNGAADNDKFVLEAPGGAWVWRARKDGSAITTIIRGTASQGAGDILQIQNDGNSILSRFRADGAFQTEPSGAKPTCNAAARFTFWTVAGGSGVKDTVEVCAKDAANNYAWRTIY